MTIRLKVMPEIGLPPINIESEDGEWRDLDYQELQEMFGVPDHVIRAFEEWDSHLGEAIWKAGPWGLGWKSPEEEQHWRSRLRPMAELLAAHVPDEVEVTWGIGWPPSSGRRHADQ